MIDPAQTALFLVIIVLTILLLALGIQVFFILRELRQTINKANKVLDDTGIITESVSGPISNLSNMASGLKMGSIIASLLSRKKQEKRLVMEHNKNNHSNKFLDGFLWGFIIGGAVVFLIGTKKGKSS